MFSRGCFRTGGFQASTQGISSGVEEPCTASPSSNRLHRSKTQEQEGQEIEKIVVVKDIDGEGAYFLANIHPVIGKRARLQLMGVFN